MNDNSILVKITPQDGEMLSQIQVGDVLIFGKVKHVQKMAEFRKMMVPVYTIEEMSEKARKD